MDRSEPSQRLLLSGLIVSVIAHAALWVTAAVYVRNPAGELGEKPKKAVIVEQRQPAPLVKLGVDDSLSKGVAWLGFKEPTPHQAAPAAVDQSALTLAAGVSKPATGGGTPALAPPASPPEVTSRQVQEAAQAMSDIGSRLIAAARPVAPAQPKQSESRQSSPGKQGSGAESGASGDRGLQSDKESVGTSVKNAPEVRLGQVAAVNGLDIQTRSPRFSTTTMLTRRPANPTIQITFGADGKVVRASFAKEGRMTYSTGSPDVDEPLLSAVYSWVARGQRLAELTSKDPNREVTILITVLF